MQSLKGETSKLAIHAVGSKVVDSVFRNFPPKITAPLKQEFYGPHFALFAADVVNTPTSDGSKKSTIPTLESNLKIAPDKKEPALEFILSILNKCIEKSLFGFSYFQELFSEYVAVASPTAVRSLIPSVADHTIHMLSTKAGTRGVISCISYGTAKDRKRIMKSLKGFVRSSLLHRDAYLAILRLVQVTDDTVSTFKSVLNEVLALPETEKDNETSPLLEIATHETGSKLLLLVLTEDNDVLRKYFDPYERSLLFGDTPTVEENGEQVPTSKKNPETRRRELVQHLREPLIELTAKNPSQLLWSVPGSRILREVYSCFHPKVLVDAVVNICELDLSEHATTEAGSDGDTHSRSLFEDPVAHHSVKNLLAVDANRAHTDGISFAKEFYNKLGDRFPQIGSSNRGAFVVTALVKVPTITSDVLKRLKKEKKLWQKLAEGPGATAGFKALLNEISPPPKV
jgi:pumilio family protein 6